MKKERAAKIADEADEKLKIKVVEIPLYTLYEFKNSNIKACENLEAQKSIANDQEKEEIDYMIGRLLGTRRIFEEEIKKKERRERIIEHQRFN